MKDKAEHFSPAEIRVRMKPLPHRGPDEVSSLRSFFIMTRFWMFFHISADLRMMDDSSMFGFNGSESEVLTGSSVLILSVS